MEPDSNRSTFPKEEMVSLDARNQFIDDMRESPASCFTLALILGEDCSSTSPTTVADRAARAIISNDSPAFEKVVKELESRKIKADADWVLDDFLLFALLVGSKKFYLGDQLCKAIIGQRRPTNEFDIAFNDALRGLTHDAFAIEGAFSFAKLVFCDLLGRLRIDRGVARTVYREVSRPGFLENLSTFPKLLAFRAFDILVERRIEDELDSVDAIVSAIQMRSDEMSVRDWWKITTAMRPATITWIVGSLITLSIASFSIGRWCVPAFDSRREQTVPGPNLPEID